MLICRELVCTKILKNRKQKKNVKNAKNFIEMQGKQKNPNRPTNQITQIFYVTSPLNLSITSCTTFLYDKI